MGGHDSQKLRPWREGSTPLQGAGKPPAHSKLNTVTKNCGGISQSAIYPACRVLTQLLAAWVIFGKQTWVTSRKRRRSCLSLSSFRHLKHQIARGAITLIAATGLIPSRSSRAKPGANVSLGPHRSDGTIAVAAIKVIAPRAPQTGCFTG